VRGLNVVVWSGVMLSLCWFECAAGTHTHTTPLHCQFCVQGLAVSVAAEVIIVRGVTSLPLAALAASCRHQLLCMGDAGRSRCSTPWLWCR
jgi:hypothetical protein